MKLSSRVYKRVQPALGTFVEISVQSSKNPHASISLAFKKIKKLEKIFNFYDPESELSRLNQTHDWVSLSKPLAKVLNHGAQTEGFKIMPACQCEKPCYNLLVSQARRRATCVFDLGGIAKGFIVDQVFLELRRRHPDLPICVNAGGDLRWSHPQAIEIRIPTLLGEKRFELQTKSGAAATSSCLPTRVGVPSARYSEPDLSVASVTAFASSCMMADAMTKKFLFSKAPNRPGVFCFDAQGRLL